jgi:hypothetical protein
MGGSSYNMLSRSARTADTYTKSASLDSIFTQNTLRRLHESMEPKIALLRECRDSEVHPLAIPIFLNLDVTGSMGQLPKQIIVDGLPHIIDKIIQAGIPSPAILFGAIGDHMADSAPFQVGQFESGDVELDTWLSRTWIEKGGGANAGESYSLPWAFTTRIQTDHWEKRQKKGFLITIGDEPNLKSYPKNVLDSVMAGAEKAYTDEELLELAQEKWEVFHILIKPVRGAKTYWNELLGQRCIEVDSFETIADTIADIVIQNQVLDIEHPLVAKENVVNKIINF